LVPEFAQFFFQVPVVGKNAIVSRAGGNRIPVGGMLTTGSIPMFELDEMLRSIDIGD
jgi:hypothetical protein